MFGGHRQGTTQRKLARGGIPKQRDPFMSCLPIQKLETLLSLHIALTGYVLFSITRFDTPISPLHITLNQSHQLADPSYRKQCQTLAHEESSHD
jgi:hypothetical protein